MTLGKLDMKTFRQVMKSGQQAQTVTLFAATLFGVALGVLCSIINTRFLAPEDYGNVRYVQNIIQLIASLLLFGYFLSGSRMLALSESEQRSRHIRGVMVLILAVSCVVLAASLCLCFFVHSAYGEQTAPLFLISIPVCFYPLFLNYINTVAQGDNHIGRLALARFMPQLLYIPLAYFVFSTYGATAERMIIAQWGIYTIFLLLVIISTHPQIGNTRSVFAVLNDENKRYGFQLYIGSLVMVATNYIAGITLGLFNDDNVEVGYYTLALTVTSPLSMLPAIIGTTYFKKFATQPRIPDRVMKASVVLTVLSCFCFILIIKPMVVFLYTESYSQVGTYAAWLALGFSIHGFGDMLNRYLGSHGQGSAIRNSSIANGVFKVFGYVVLVYFWNTEGAILTNVVCSCIYCAVLLYYYRNYTSCKDESK